MQQIREIRRLHWQHEYKRINWGQLSQHYQRILEDLLKAKVLSREIALQWQADSYVSWLYRAFDKKCEEAMFAIERGDKKNSGRRLARAATYPELIKSMENAANSFKPFEKLSDTLPENWGLQPRITAIIDRTSRLLYQPTRQDLLYPKRSIKEVQAQVLILSGINPDLLTKEPIPINHTKDKNSKNVLNTVDALNDELAQTVNLFKDALFKDILPSADSENPTDSSPTAVTSKEPDNEEHHNAQ